MAGFLECLQNNLNRIALTTYPPYTEFPPHSLVIFTSLKLRFDQTVSHIISFVVHDRNSGGAENEHLYQRICGI